MDEKKLTFELSPDKDFLEIHCNKKGLNDFLFYLQRLLNGDSTLPRHDHLMTPSWSGHELTEKKYDQANELINQVNIYLWE